MCSNGPRRSATRATTEPVELLQRREKLSPHQEYEAVVCVSDCYHALLDFKAALPQTQRLVVLAQLHGPRSHGHAAALKGLCMV
jgi:hypothetical protein